MKTNQGTPSVDWFSNLVKTNEAEAWWLGTKKRTTAMVSTPRMCHHALTLERNATTRTLKLLIRPWTMRTQAYTVSTQPVVSGKFVVRFKKTVKKVANPIVDAGRDGHLAQQVEPSGEPTPGGGVVLGQLGRPVVQTARRRVGRCDLGHPEADEQRHGADDDPAPHDHHRPAVRHAEVVEGEAARQHRDDGEGDGEVGEAAHPPPQLLPRTRAGAAGLRRHQRRLTCSLTLPVRHGACAPRPICPAVSQQDSTGMSRIHG